MILLTLLSNFTNEPTLILSPPRHCGACGFGTGESFVHTLPAETLSAGRWGVSLRFDWQEFDAFSNSELLNFAAQGVGAHSIDRGLALRAGVVHALDDRWTVGFDLPFIHNQNLREAFDNAGTPDIKGNGDQNGLGDLSAFAQWNAWRDVESRRFASLYFGTKIPTGETHETASDGERLEPDHQPGSGSFDPFVGLALSKSYGTTSMAGSTVYSFAGDGSQQSNLGDVLRVNLGLGYSPEKTEAGDGQWRWMLELNGQWHERMQIDGGTDPNSGGVQVFVSPGIRWTSLGGLSWFASIGVPLVQNLYGEQSDTEFRGSTGIGYAI